MGLTFGATNPLGGHHDMCPKLDDYDRALRSVGATRFTP